jgi:hypothetical protein
MPGPQSVVNNQLASVMPGAPYLDGPVQAAGWQLESSGIPNIIGATAFTATSEGLAAAGGTNSFAGILANSKVYASYGTSGGGPLSPTMTLADGAVGELVTMHTGLAVTVTTSWNIGDKLVFLNSTGALSTLPPGTAVPGGSTLVPNSKMVRFAGAAAGVGVVQFGPS